MLRWPISMRACRRRPLASLRRPTTPPRTNSSLPVANCCVRKWHSLPAAAPTHRHFCWQRPNGSRPPRPTRVAKGLLGGVDGVNPRRPVVDRTAQLGTVSRSGRAQGAGRARPAPGHRPLAGWPDRQADTRVRRCRGPAAGGDPGISLTSGRPRPPTRAGTISLRACVWIYSTRTPTTS